jgi:hypothetical protein
VYSLVLQVGHGGNNPTPEKPTFTKPPESVGVGRGIGQDQLRVPMPVKKEKEEEQGKKKKKKKKVQSTSYKTPLGCVNLESRLGPVH